MNAPPHSTYFPIDSSILMDVGRAQDLEEADETWTASEKLAFFPGLQSMARIT